jgi:hypothetical protein
MRAGDQAMSSRDLATLQTQELFEEHAVFYPLTIEAYHSLIESGDLPEGEPFELLGGHIVRKDRSEAGGGIMTVGHYHAWVVGELTALNSDLQRYACHLRAQLPLAIAPNNEPEPDGSIVRGVNRDYQERHPEPADVSCAIEVAYNSLKRDRSSKLRAYAAAGIPCYIIINLVEKVIEVYTQPSKSAAELSTYGNKLILKPGEMLNLPTPNGGSVIVEVSKLLP